MSEFVFDDHMDGIRSLQAAIDNNMPFNFVELDLNYKMIYDEPNGRSRFWYAKIVSGKVQALSTFGFEEGPDNGTDRYSVNYAVSESCRGRGLAVEAVNIGINDLRKRLKHFYVEALIEKTNVHSIEVAKKLFPDFGVPTINEVSAKPALLFYKLIEF
ncbi:MAG: GNAT family N-acetyltransferase [Pseudobdellovibrio sp.]